MATVFVLRNDRVEIYPENPLLLSWLDDALAYVGDPNNPSAAVPADIDDPGYIWDGVTRFLHRPKTIPPWFPGGLFPRAAEVMARAQAAFQVVDERVRPEEDVPRYPTPIPLWAHQERLVRRFFMERVVGDEGPRFGRWVPGQGVFVASPRSGKTRCGFEWFRRVNQPCLWVAPSSAIVKQTIRAAREFFDESDVQELSAKTPADALQRAWFVVGTAAAVLKAKPDFFLTRQALVLDEFHHYPRNGEWTKHMWKHMPHVYWRLGLTGTHGRSGLDGLALEATIGEVVDEVTPAELLAKELLVGCYVAFIPVPGQLTVKRGSPFNQGGHGTVGIHEHAWRQKTAAAAAAHLMAQGRRVLVIGALKVQVAELRDLVETYVPGERALNGLRHVEVVTGETEDRHEQAILDSFRARGVVQCIVATSCIGEGVDLPSADGIVWARGESAWIPYVQGLYRVATAEPKKRNAVIVDFNDRHHPKLLEHSVARFRTAQETGIMGVTLLEHAEQFAGWLSQIPGRRV